LRASLASVRGQLLDPAYQSDARLSFDFTAGAGRSFQALADFLKISVAKVQVTETLPISRTPTGRLSADRDAFEPGQTVHFRLDLDPENLEFLGMGYDVDEVRVYRTVEEPDGSKGTRLVASRRPATGENGFILEFIPLDQGTVAGNFFPVVVTTLPPRTPMELANTLPPDPTTTTVTTSTSTTTTTLEANPNGQWQGQGEGLNGPSGDCEPDQLIANTLDFEVDIAGRQVRMTRPETITGCQGPLTLLPKVVSVFTITVNGASFSGSAPDGTSITGSACLFDDGFSTFELFSGTVTGGPATQTRCLVEGFVCEVFEAGGWHFAATRDRRHISSPLTKFCQ
jgi:hypothetical protein